MRIAGIATMTTTALATLAALASLGSTAHAQDLEQPRRRQGYYLAASLLGGSSYIREDGEKIGSFTSSTTILRVGQMLTRRLGLGLQINIGGGTRKTQTAATNGVGLEGQVELVPNLALHAGFGLGVMQLKDSAVKNEELRGAFGAQYNLGLSYAWFPFSARPSKSGGFALTPMLQVRFIPGDTATALATLVGVDIGWWTGLPRNQLELPPEDAYQKEK